MLGIHDYPVFLTAAILLNLTPGPDTMYIIGRSVAQGRRAGIASALGISAGCLGHTMAAALGLSSVLAASAVAFTMVKYAGAAYLVYLGIKMIVTTSGITAAKGKMQTSARFGVIFRQGVMTNLLNPKVALFFLALLPQFVDPGTPRPALSFMALGATFIVTGTIWCVTLAWFASILSGSLMQRQRLAGLVNRAIGSLLVGLGVRLALQERA